MAGAVVVIRPGLRRRGRLRPRLKLVVVTLLMSVVAMVGATVSPIPVSAETEPVTCNIVTGEDSVSQQVARLYKAVFHRPPEIEGWHYWRGTAATTSIFDIASLFVQAPEFINLYGDAANAEFVNLIYLNVMGREPEPEGYEYWLGVLDREELSRGAMVVYFSESFEFKRREDGLYFEKCDRLFEGMPSVLLSTSLAIRHEPTRSLESQTHFMSTYDASTDSSSYAKMQTSGSGDSWFGHRAGGQTCLRWKSAPLSVVNEVITSHELDHGRAFTGTSSFLEDPSVERSRIAEFQVAVRDAYGFEYDGCSADAPELARLSVPTYRLLPEIPADSVRVFDGYINRRFELHTEEIRAILALGDETILDLLPTLRTDLQAITESNVPADSIGLTIWTLEDPTGNVFTANAHYRGYVTLDGVPWTWDETTVAIRVPGG